MDRYWVSPIPANFNSAGVWSATSGGVGGASTPTLSDNAIFDTNSILGATCTVTATANCLNLTFTGWNGIFTGASALNVFGNLTLSAGMTFSYSGTLTYKSTSSGKTITTAGQIMLCTSTFQGVAGQWTLQDTYDNSTKAITITTGILFTNAKGVMALSITITSNSTTRGIDCGGGGVYELKGTANVFVNTGTQTLVTQNLSGVNFLISDSSAGEKVISTVLQTGVFILDANVKFIGGGTLKMTNSFVVFNIMEIDSATAVGFKPNASGFKDFRMTLFTGLLTDAGSLNFLGNVKFHSGMTFSSPVVPNPRLYLYGDTGSFTFDSAGLNLPYKIELIEFNSVIDGAKWTLLGDLTNTVLGGNSAINISVGGLDFNDFNVTTNNFSISAGIGQTKLGSGNLNCPNVFIDPDVLYDFQCETSKIYLQANLDITICYFYGGGQTYNKIYYETFVGDLSDYLYIGGVDDKIAELTVDQSAGTALVLFDPGTPIVVYSIVLIGASAGNEIRFSYDYTVPQGPGRISAPNGTLISLDYLQLEQVQANATAGWYAGANSIDDGGNTNWHFTVPPPPSTKKPIFSMGNYRTGTSKLGVLNK